jgi:hypothetical protein
LESKDHIHFIYYKENIIIGYVHIELCLDKRAVLQVIAIKNKEYFGELLKLCKRWVKTQGYLNLNIESYLNI